MNKTEMIDFFDNNYKDILMDKTNSDIQFISNVINEDKVTKAIKQWPNEIKVLIVKRYLTK
tara:strand:+ start:516 stop:698 length:183 start_codon:yes stop_codon:yes gene_type:complete